MQLRPQKVRTNRPVIRQLDAAAINRIAAGEVVERPASAVKELIENALDANARRITIALADGGKSLIQVRDDGHGILAADLPLALSRHATSKLDGDDLVNICNFGFRGEALAALGAVGKLRVASRATGQSKGAEIVVEEGKISAVRPASQAQGTVVELRNLFHSTPARLKFLRSDRAELRSVSTVVKSLAIISPDVAFALFDVSSPHNKRQLLRYDTESGTFFEALGLRLRRILGSEFAENAIPVDAERDGIRLKGFAALPTYSRGAAVSQFIFVNNRPVKDRLLLGALRAAYSDFLSRDRHPAAVLSITCPPALVDVNVHPAKSEIRFRDPGVVRGLVISGLRHALANAGHKTATTLSGSALGAMGKSQTGVNPLPFASRPSHSANRANLAAQAPGFSESHTPFHQKSGRIDPIDENNKTDESYPLGAARAQLHENYIIAQTEDGLVIVDQHAAHERLVYEKLKNQMAQNGVQMQTLLIPEVVELSYESASLLLDAHTALRTLGLGIEPFGSNAIIVREIPAILGECNAKTLIHDIVDHLHANGNVEKLKDEIHAILSRRACHNSIRSGRRMHPDEMNALLRQMEETPHSGQCNHGRPTHITLKLHDIEKLFGRT